MLVLVVLMLETASYIVLVFVSHDYKFVSHECKFVSHECKFVSHDLTILNAGNCMFAVIDYMYLFDRVLCL